MISVRADTVVYSNSGTNKLRLKQPILQRGSGLTLDSTNNTINVGAGVNYLRVNAVVMAESLTSYLYVILQKNGTEVGANVLSPNVNGFAGVNISAVFPVTSGDKITVTHDCSGSIRGPQSIAYFEKVG